MWETNSLSRWGWLLLLKLVLHSLPIYWASIAYIPKSILEKRKKYLSFLWTAIKQIKGTHVVKLTTLILPKSRGWWGIKMPKKLFKSLGSKSLWRIEENPISLCKKPSSKYFPDYSIVEWFRKPKKTQKNGSIGWKAFVQYFPLVENRYPGI